MAYSRGNFLGFEVKNIVLPSLKSFSFLFLVFSSFFCCCSTALFIYVFSCGFVLVRYSTSEPLINTI